MHSRGDQHIGRGSLSGLFLSLFGHRYQGIEITDSGLTLLARTSKDVPFTELAGPALVTKTLGFSAVALPINGGNDLKVAGVRPAEAANFVSSINNAWRRHFLEQVAKVDEELRILSEIVGRLRQPRRYPSACLL